MIDSCSETTDSRSALIGWLFSLGAPEDTEDHVFFQISCLMHYSCCFACKWRNICLSLSALASIHKLERDLRANMAATPSVKETNHPLRTWAAVK